MSSTTITRVGQLVFATGCTLGAYVTAEWIGAAPLAAAVPAALVLGIVLLLIGMDTETETKVDGERSDAAYEWEDG